MAAEKDCVYCRRWWHYPDDWREERERGRPVLSRRGAEQPWPPGTGPKCGSCVKPLAWTPDNRRLVQQVRLWQACGGRDAALRALGWTGAGMDDPLFLEALLILEEEERLLAGEQQTRSVAHLLAALIRL